MMCLQYTHISKNYGIIKKNKDINPLVISQGSSLDVWWKCEKGHSKNNKKNKQLVRRSRGGVKSLKYPGRDRSKGVPTPKRPKKVKNKPMTKEVKEAIENKCSARNNDDYTVALDGSHSSVIAPMTITGNTIINNYPIYRIL